MRIGAFFDLDGTLLPPPTLERRFLHYLRRRGELGAASLARFLARFARTSWRDWLRATHGNKTYLTGVHLSAVDRFLAASAPLEFPLAALARIEWHAAQGHRLFLVTGTLRPLAEHAATQMAAALAQGWLRRSACEIGIAATVPEVRGAQFTGEVVGGCVSGTGKPGAMERLAARAGVVLAESYAYGDAWGDRWMLARVGYPAAVNANWRLRRVARQQGWNLLDWRKKEAPQRHKGTERWMQTLKSGA